MNKRIITIIFALAAICGGASAKNKVIDRPAFKSTSTNDLLPVKVELTKTATIVHFRMVCAHRRDWSMDGARLECSGQRYAYKEGRIITHEGKKVLIDEAFEIGKKYAKNAQQDSVILSFEPMPKGTKTFDYVEADNDGAWKIRGIRLDNQLYPLALPPYQRPADDGAPLQPLFPRRFYPNVHTLYIYFGDKDTIKRVKCQTLTPFITIVHKFVDHKLVYCDYS